MNKKIISSPNAPAAIGPYSQAVTEYRLLFISGQLPIDMATGDLITDDIERATRACLRNLQSIIEDAGGTMDNTLKVTVYLTSMDDFSKVNEVYAQYFQSDYPARSCVAVAALPRGARMEIEAIASIGSPQKNIR